MKVATLLNLSVASFRQKFLKICPEERLPDLPPQFIRAFDRDSQRGHFHSWNCSPQAYLESCDESGDVHPTEAGKFPFKMASEKEYLTPFG